MARLGYAAVATAAVMWAAGATVAGRLLERGASALELTGARSWIAVAGIGAIVVARGRRPKVRAPLVAVIPFGLALAAANYFYYASIGRLPVAIAIVIQYTAPAMVVSWAAVVQRRRPSSRVITALTLTLLGVMLLAELPRAIAEGELSLDPWGIAMAFGSALAFAAYILIGEGIGRLLGPDRAMFRGFAIAALFWAVAIGVGGGPATIDDRSFALPVAFLGIGATIAPFLLFLWGLGKIGSSRAGIASTLEPVAGAVFAFVWLDQSLSVAQMAGAAIVVAGIAMVQSELPPPEEVAAEHAAVK